MGERVAVGDGVMVAVGKGVKVGGGVNVGGADVGVAVGAEAHPLAITTRNTIARKTGTIGFFMTFSPLTSLFSEASNGLRSRSMAADQARILLR